MLQLMPQAPQLVALLKVLTQTPEQLISPFLQQSTPGVALVHTHVPPWHSSPGAQVSQVEPSVPQAAALVPGSQESLSPSAEMHPPEQSHWPVSGTHLVPGTAQLCTSV